MRVPYSDVLDSHILAPERMDVPARGVLEGAVLEQDALAFPEGDHHGAEEGLDILLIQGRIRIIEGAGGGAGGRIALVREPVPAVLRDDAAALQDILPFVVGDLGALDLAPVFAAAVEDAAAGDRDVGRAGGVQRRHAAPHVQALEIRPDDGIQELVRVEHDDGVLVHVQLDMAFQFDGAGAPDAGGDDQASPAPAGEGVDGRLEPVRVHRHAVADGAEVGQEGGAVGDGRELHPGHVEGKALVQGGVFIFLSTLAGDCQDGQGKEEKACFHLWSLMYACKYKKYF